MRRRGRRRISRATLWGLFGAVLLAAGCFAPIAALPVGGEATLLGGGSIPARLILIAAVSSVALILLGRHRALLITGTFTGLMVLVEFLSHQNELATLSGTGSPESVLLSSFSHEWGWASLVIGAALLLLAGLFPGRCRHPVPSTRDRSGSGNQRR